MVFSNSIAMNPTVEVVSNFPEECRYVLESLAEVYGYEAQAEERGLSAEERLRFHQEHSGPVMERLHASGCSLSLWRRKSSRTPGWDQQ